MGWTGCVHFEKFHRNFMVQTFALTALVQPSLHQVLCCNKTIPNAPKLHKTHQNLRIWSNGVDRVHSLQKFWHDFMARTFSLIAPVQPKLYSNKMILNALKPYETHQNMSLGSNEVDLVCSLQKCLMRLRWPNFCINCNSSACFASSFVQ